jgi:hypothetical protein
MLNSPDQVSSFPMKLRDDWEPRRYEQRLQALRWERKAEAKQTERLSAVLAKKVRSIKSKAVAARVA